MGKAPLRYILTKKVTGNIAKAIRGCPRLTQFSDYPFEICHASTLCPLKVKLGPHRAEVSIFLWRAPEAIASSFSSIFSSTVPL
jgi:hypothetical protein